jgi:hypothetical protein
VFVRNAAAHPPSPTSATSTLAYRKDNEQFALIGTAFADVGVPSSQVVRAIQNIIYGDSNALRPMDEDW